MTEQQQGQVPPNQARKTIKLKPLTKKVPKVMMTPEQIAQAAEASANQTAQGATVMQTNAQGSRPVTLSTPTVISPLVTQKTEGNDTIVLNPPSAPAEMPADDSTRKVGKQAAPASPLSIMPNAKQTIKLRPTPAAPSAMSEAIGAQKTAGASTIKLTPTPVSSASVPPSPENLDEEIFDDKTVAMTRPQRATAQPTTVPGSLIPTASASTINLTPEESAAPASVVTSGAPTLKLKPKLPATSSTSQTIQSPAPAASASSVAQPKSPTIKLKVNTSSITQSSPAASSVPPPPAAKDDTAPTVPTLKLKPPTPGSQTIPSSSAASVDMTKSKLQLKRTPPPPAMKEGELAPANAPTFSEQQAKEAAAASNPEPSAEAPAVAASGRNEPSMIFSIAAILTFCSIAFVVYMVSWQYYLQWIKPGSPTTISAVAAAPKANVAAPVKDAPAADKKDQPATAKPAEKPADKKAAPAADKKDQPAKPAAAPAADKKADAKK
jgi:hypothetical protein